MIRRIAGLFFIMLIYSVSSAQEPMVNKSNENFSTAGFLRIELSEFTSPEFKNRIRIKAKRVLTNQVFIIDAGLLTDISNYKQWFTIHTLQNNSWKLSSLAEKLNSETTYLKVFTFNLQVTSPAFIEKIKRDFAFFSPVDRKIGNQLFLTVTCTPKNIREIFINDDAVLSIDVFTKKPVTELAVPGFDLSANRLNLVHSEYPSIAGEGREVSLKEDFFDSTDIDLKGRFVYSPLASPSITNHANFMATIIAGSGNSVDYAKGAAWKAKISPASFAQVLPETDNYYKERNIQVQNHSYGSDIDNNYGANAVAFDESTISNPGLLHVFSSGNSGDQTSTTGTYKGIQGYANLTGNYKMAKNIITVGAVDSFGKVAPLSSCGPAYDGRIKPELVAFQQNGTSEAAALVSGTSVLLQQYYQSVFQQPMEAALTKAVLINSADDINAPGPDYKTGFGNLNAFRAMKTIEEKQIFQGIVTGNVPALFNIDIPSNTRLLKITMVWNDTTASAGIPKALINDLDLEVSNNSTHWQPWILSSFPSADSLNKIAVRGKDSLNNVEQVTIENPPTGVYSVNVLPFNLPTGHQSFYVVFSLDSSNSFKWERMTKEDFAVKETNTLLKWKTTFSGKGNIEYALADNNWKSIATDVDLTAKNIYWKTPDTISRARVRVAIEDKYFYSDTFFITQLPGPTTGFVCGDSLFIYWQKIKGVEQYQLYRLGNNFLEPFKIVTGTNAVIKKNELNGTYIAVAPLVNNQPAIKSYAFDYLQQGAACYINSFYTELQGNEAKLNVGLGTLYGVDSISFEKMDGINYTSFQTIAPNSSLNYSATYNKLLNGINTFRAKIILSNGQIIYSNPEAVYYAAPGKYVLVPNPVRTNSLLSLIGPVPNGEIITLTDMAGRKIFQKQIISVLDFINTSGISAGVYFYQVIKDGKKNDSGKLVVLQ